MYLTCKGITTSNLCRYCVIIHNINKLDRINIFRNKVHQSLLRFIRYATLNVRSTQLYHPSETLRAAVVYCVVIVIIVGIYYTNIRF